MYGLKNSSLLCGEKGKKLVYIVYYYSYYQREICKLKSKFVHKAENVNTTKLLCINTKFASKTDLRTNLILLHTYILVNGTLSCSVANFATGAEKDGFCVICTYGPIRAQ